MTRPELILYRGFGTSQRVCVAGRLIRPSQLVPARDNASLRRRLRDAWKLLVSRTVPQADVELRCGETTWTVTTDNHGYFISSKALDGAHVDGLWQTYAGKVHDNPRVDGTVAEGHILQASGDADQLIISDIDDTVVHTGVANKLIMMWHLYVSDADDRAPFPGMSAFLEGLHRGSSGRSHNPMIYVSRSPWSIYPLLEDVFNRHDIPVGPVLLLRDWGISWRHPWPRRAQAHKAQMIDRVMETYLDLPAILIGDSGQRDPETYLAAADRYGDRIRAIYIRDLGLDVERTQQLHAMSSQLKARGIHFLAAGDTAALAADASERGFIAPDQQKKVAEEYKAEHL